MSLGLYYHPLSSCCWKVLVALYELGVPFEGRFLDLGDPVQRSEFLGLSPAGKMPLLVDGARVVPETSIIIEYLVRRHAPRGKELLPADPDTALEVRLLDRLLDCYVMTPMQAIVADRIRAEEDRDPVGVQKERDTLARAYGMLERRLADRGARRHGSADLLREGARGHERGDTWMAGGAFSMADCAAAPALFYASTLVPFSSEHPRLAAYFERLVQRPSVARVLEEARPYFRFYPFREALPERFLQAASAR